MKDNLNQIYQDLLVSGTDESLLKLIQALMINIDNHELISSLWKATIKTLIKLLGYQEVINTLNHSAEFDTLKLVKSLMEAKFEIIDQSEEEQMLLLIQKTLLKILQSLTISEDTQFQIFTYFLKVLKKKTIDDADSTYSLQFSDLTKKNLHKALFIFMAQDEEHQVKHKILEFLFDKIRKAIQNLEKKPDNANKLREYICFSIKTLEDCFRKVSSDQEIKQIFSQHTSKLVGLVCQAAEFDDIMIRNQSQLLFTLLLGLILDLELPMREELEVMLVKIVLKPALAISKKLGQASDLIRQNSDVNKNQAPKEESDLENDDFIQVSHERSFQDDLLLELSTGYLLETLLNLSAQQLAQLFLLYDCQPFAESIITKALMMIMKVSSKSSSQYLQVVSKIVGKLSQINTNGLKIERGGPAQIPFMLEQKQTVKRLTKDANVKYKVFMQKIEQMYSYLEGNATSEVASKILVYSRDLQIDKIAEIIGEKSLRKFLQTFRLAGVDSQVVLRILEHSSYRIYDHDKSGYFASKEEAYEFAYLIIVLQTCQHNPSVKQKTDLKSFVESAHIVCPKSKDTMPQNFFEKIYNSITNNAFYTPVSRSLLQENFNPYNMNEIAIRLSQAEDREKELSESEFVNSADLTQKQIFHYSNSTKVPSSLIPQAMKHLLTFITQRFIKYCLSQSQTHASHIPVTEIQSRFSTLKNLVSLNKAFNNNEYVDKLFQVMYKVNQSHLLTDEKMHQEMEQLLQNNFECIKRSLVLIPKLSIQTFMKDEIKDSLKASFTSVKRLVMMRQQERKKQKSDKTKNPQQPTQKQPSFFDLVYNYFTENNEDQDDEEKNDKAELDILISLQKRILLEDKEENYMECIEERFNDKTDQQWEKQSSRIHELINLISAYVRENSNQEEGILCLAFLKHIISKLDSNIETLEKIWVELHLLMNQCIKSKPIEPLLRSNSSQKEEKKGEFDVISTDTSQDSIDLNSNSQAELDLFVKETCQIKIMINEAVIRHMILSLSLDTSKKIIRLKSNNQHVIRDIQRVASIIAESDSKGNIESYGLFDDLQLFSMFNIFIQDLDELKQYPKLSKFIRLMLILILRSFTKNIDSDSSFCELMSNKMVFFQLISQILSESSTQLPLDLISLALDIYSKAPLDKLQPNDDSSYLENALESATIVIDNLSIAFQKKQQQQQDISYDLWFSMIQNLQEKVLYNINTKRYKNVSIQSFNVLKNLAMNHPFELEMKNQAQVKKLFADILFWQTFENLNQPSNKTSQNNSSSTSRKEEKKSTDTTTSQVDNEDIYEDYLESSYQICVCNLSDIFIYYISILFKDSEALHHQEASANDENGAQLFIYLWLNLLKVLLHFAEKSSDKEFNGLIQTVHDNIKRTIEFLIQQGILVQNSENPEMVKLWKTTWEIVTAFFTSMKVQVLGLQASNQVEKKK